MQAQIVVYIKRYESSIQTSMRRKTSVMKRKKARKEAAEIVGVSSECTQLVQLACFANSSTKPGT